MRKALAIAAAALLATTVAKAEDKPVYTGFYAGVMAGYTTAALTTPGTDFGATGAFGGGFVGYGVENPVTGLYLGVEADAMIRDIKWTYTQTAATITATNDWVGTARARIGQAFGPVLLYGTGGLAVTRPKVTVAGMGSDQEYRYGWVAGGGAEATIGKGMLLRVEVLQFGYPDKDFTFQNLTTTKLGAEETVGRVGLGWRF